MSYSNSVELRQRIVAPPESRVMGGEDRLEHLVHCGEVSRTKHSSLDGQEAPFGSPAAGRRGQPTVAVRPACCQPLSTTSPRRGDVTRVPLLIMATMTSGPAL